MTGAGELQLVSADRVVFLVDVDNTLYDNDAAKAELDRRMVELLGPEGAARFWVTYETVREQESVVNIPLTVARYADDYPGVDEVALADIFMRFPFPNYVLPGAFRTLAHLRWMGKVAILSDGDPVYQMTKILRSGLAAATDGYVFVFRHKEEHVAEFSAALAGDQYVVIDDKPLLLPKIAERMTAPLTTVFVRQGHYAESVPPGQWAGAGLTIERIADLCQFDLGTLLAAGTAPDKQGAGAH